jgi:hypothetical protein
LFGGDDAARHQLVAETWLGGDDDDRLGGIGGEQLLAPGVAAVEQGAARRDGDDDAVVGRGQLDADAVAAGDMAFLAARVAERESATVDFDFVLPAEGGDDGAFGKSRSPRHGGPYAACSCAMRAAAGGWES